LQQAGLGQQQRAGTHRAKPAHLAFGPTQPGEQRRVLPLQLDALPTRNQQRIQLGRRQVVPAGIDAQAYAAGARHRLERFAQQQRLIDGHPALALQFDVG